MLRELKETLNHIWNRLRRTESWIYGMSQMPLIIEEGTEGIWRYRKWSNGVAECWGKYSATISHYTSAFGGYGYNTGFLAFPTNLFIEAPIPTFSACIGNGFALTGTLTGAISATNCTFYAVATASGSQSTIWYIHVIGKWKTTTDTPQNFIDLLYDAHVWDYNYLDNLPKINSVTLSGNKTDAELNLASKTDLDYLRTVINGVISEGGEPNFIDSISVNGSIATPDINKNVALTIPVVHTSTSEPTTQDGNDGDIWLIYEEPEIEENI